MLASTTNINLKISLKPYTSNFSDNYVPGQFTYYEEHQDLKDLKNASIKELKIESSYYSHESKFRRDLMYLLRNTNIKKIVLELGNPSLDFLLFISKLIRKNTTIKEIKLITLIHYYSRKEFYNNAWFYFINTISSRLVKLEHKNYTGEYLKFDSLLLRNPNFKEIEIELGRSDCTLYPENIKDVLSSEKYLDDFSISAMKAFNNEFYDTLSKIKTKAEIDTLHIKSTNTDNGLVTIENAYLFNVKTIRISLVSELKLFNAMLKLSNNPHNTVKRIIIDESEKNLDEIISELKSLDLKDYNLVKLPKIYLYGYRELILDEANNEHSFLKIGEYDEYYTGKNEKNYINFFLILQRNSIEVNNLTELLYILFNSPSLLRKLTVEYDKINMKQENTNQYLVENSKRIILGMMEIYEKFKVDKFQSKRNTAGWIYFKFNSPEMNFVYFSVLEIMVLMKIEIENLILDGCPISELVEFLEKHKSLNSLNINDIELRYCETIDKENIEKLYQYSHLIENKISIGFNREYIHLWDECVQIELMDVFHSRLRNYNNFVALSQEAFPLLIEKLDFTRYYLSDYIRKVKTFENSLKFMNYINFCKHIEQLEIDCDQYDLKTFSNQFSFLKKYEYDLMIVYFYNEKKSSIRNRLIMFLIVFETICNSKYRLIRVNSMNNRIEGGKFSKKFKRYLKLHIHSVELCL